jgi:hypothetical protein
MPEDIIVNGRRTARDLSGGGFFLHRVGNEGASDMEPHPTLGEGGGGGASLPPRSRTIPTLPK